MISKLKINGKEYDPRMLWFRLEVAQVFWKDRDFGGPRQRIFYQESECIACLQETRETSVYVPEPEPCTAGGNAGVRCTCRASMVSKRANVFFGERGLYHRAEELAKINELLNVLHLTSADFGEGRVRDLLEGKDTGSCFTFRQFFESVENALAQKETASASA